MNILVLTWISEMSASVLHLVSSISSPWECQCALTACVCMCCDAMSWLTVFSPALIHRHQAAALASDVQPPRQPTPTNPLCVSWKWKERERKEHWKQVEHLVKVYISSTFKKVLFKRKVWSCWTELYHLRADAGRTGTEIKSTEMNESPRTKALSRSPSG